MSIQKESEAYLKMLVGNDAISNEQADTLKLMPGGSHFYTYGNQVSVAKLDLINWGWNSWVKAKSQAVPEGFVLVPKEPTEAMMYAGYGSKEKTDNLRINYIAMIEAQEQSHD